MGCSPLAEHYRSDSGKKARLTDRWLVFVDESSIYLESVLATTWARRGQTPVLDAIRSWEKVTVIAVLSVAPASGATDLTVWLTTGRINGNWVFEFMRDQLRWLGDCYLIWDNWGPHKVAARRLTTDWQRTSTSTAVDVRFLPTYAPDLNPVEPLWKILKCDRLANYVPEDLAALETRLDQELAALGDRPELLQSLVRWAHFPVQNRHSNL